jgi:PTS system sucrose-specific IIC component
MGKHNVIIIAFGWGELTIRSSTKEFTGELIQLLGGNRNIADVTHCATRLRLTLLDESKADIAALEKLDSVQGVFSRGGQIQIVFGSGIVNKIYKSLMEDTGTAEVDHPAERTDSPHAKLHPVIKIITVLSNIFVPIIPVIVAMGLLKGVIGMLNAFQWVSPDSSWMNLLELFSSSVFVIFPILIGFSAAKEFGSSPFMGAAIGGILTHADLLISSGGQAGKVFNHLLFLGENVNLAGYQGTVIPILISVFVMGKLEKGLRKIVPPSLDVLVIPFLTFVCTGMLALLMLGPLGTTIGYFISGVLKFIYMQSGFIAGFLFGGLYSLIVLTGLHHGFQAIEAGLLADPKIGVNFLLPIWSMANIAQGGAGLAVFFKSKNKKTRKIAIPAVLSSFLGIVEPVIFGVNLKLIRPFIGAAVGGALGGAYVVSAHVGANSFGLTGIPMIAIVAPLGMSNLIHYLIGFAIAVVSSFAVTWFLGIREENEAEDDYSSETLNTSMR